MSRATFQKRIEGAKKIKEGIKQTIINRPNTTIGTNGISLSDNPTNRSNRLEGVKKTMQGFKELIFNHDEWWSNYKSESDNLVTLNLALRKGLPQVGYSKGDSDYRGIPSVAGLVTHLTIPNTNNMASATDYNTTSYMLAVNKIWNSIRRANAGSVNYNVEALHRYIFAARNLIAVTATLDRASALLRSFDAYDNTIPAAYFCASSLDYDTFRANAANLSNYTELLKIKLRTLLPLDLDLFKYTYWMFSNVFKESDDAKASEYMFFFTRLTSFYGTGASTIRNTAIVAAQSGTTTGITYANFIAAIDIAVNDLVNNDVFNIIAGDILKAFGTNSFTKINLYGQNEPVRKVYDEKILTKIQNARIFGEGYTPIIQPVTTGGSLHTAFTIERVGWNSTYQLDDMSYPVLKNPFINSYKNSLTPAEVISITRFAYVLGPSMTITTSAQHMYDASWGTEIVARCEAITVQLSSTYQHHFLKVMLGHTLASSGDPSNVTSAWCAFDYAPWTCIYDQSYGNLGQMFDFNNFGRVDKGIVDTLNDIATYSILFTPEVARVSKVEVF